MTNRPVAVDSGETATNDNLPLPHVVYPSHYGTFIGFKRSPGGELYFCACTREAIRNYLEHAGDPLESAVGNAFPVEFQEMVVEQPLESVSDVLSTTNFKQGICHKCNAVVPNRRYCVDMYGSVFSQNYGWYVSQKKIEYGFPPVSYESTVLSAAFLDQLPSDVVDLIDADVKADIESKTTRFEELDQKRRSRRDTLRRLQRKAERDVRERHRADEITPDEAWGENLENKEKYDHERVLNDDEHSEWQSLRDELQTAEKRISEAAENEVRRSVGHYERGSRWTTETILYQLIETMYGDEYTIERHHRPEWLNSLELDVFLVEPKVGVEYQGVQHYEAVEHWGGEEALEDRQERDRRTRELCEENRVELVEIRYDEEISQELVDERIGQHLETQ